MGQLAVWEALCMLYGRLRCTKVIASVMVDGPDDPRVDDGVLGYELELSNGQYSYLRSLVENEPRIVNISGEKELIEELSHYEHASWARWMNYLFSKCQRSTVEYDESLTIPQDLVRRWKKQAETEYADLSEAEKESDRKEVAHILPIIKEYAAKP